MVDDRLKTIKKALKAEDKKAVNLFFYYLEMDEQARVVLSDKQHLKKMDKEEKAAWEKQILTEKEKNLILSWQPKTERGKDWKKWYDKARGEYARKYIKKLAEWDLLPRLKEKEKTELIEFLKQPPEMDLLQRKLLSGTGITKKAYKGVTERKRTLTSGETQTELFYTWPTKPGVEAFYPVEKQDKIQKDTPPPGQREVDFIPAAPKLAVSQEKNIDTLAIMLQKANQQRINQEKEPKAQFDFSFKEYALTRGYSEADIKKGGKFINELKKDLYSGAYTTYRVDKIKLNGKTYTAHGLPNFYILFEPENKKDPWKVAFNEPYGQYYLNCKQFHRVYLKAIQDKNTNKKKGYLYRFFKLVVRYEKTDTGKEGYTPPPLKVDTILNDIKATGKTENRPGEIFKALSECIYYTATKHGIISKVIFYNKNKKVTVTGPAKFKDWTYSDFKKDVLSKAGLSDIRQAKVSFHGPEKVKELPEKPETPKAPVKVKKLNL